MDRGRRGNQFAGLNTILYKDLSNIIGSDALQYLPAKSLARFKGVCRDWKLQISNPFFAHKQSNKFHELSGFFIQMGCGPPTFISLDPTAYGVPDPSLSFLPEPVNIRTSANGLLCCQGQDDDQAYYICNPVTKTSKKLPKPNLDHGRDPALVLIFEPSPLNFEAEYSLLCACPCADLGEGYEFEIYNSKDGSWKVYGEMYLGNNKIVPTSGVHTNGVVYWQTIDGYAVLAFDLVTERLKSLYGNGTLGLLNGKLCSAKSTQQGLALCVLSNAHTNTMQMNSKVKAWEEKHWIDLSSEFPPSQFGYSPRDALYVGEKCVLWLSGHKLFKYDVKSKAFELLRENASRDVKVVAYVNSIVEI